MSLPVWRRRQFSWDQIDLDAVGFLVRNVAPFLFNEFAARTSPRLRNVCEHVPLPLVPPSSTARTCEPLLPVPRQRFVLIVVRPSEELRMGESERYAVTEFFTESLVSPYAFPSCAVRRNVFTRSAAVNISVSSAEFQSSQISSIVSSKMSRFSHDIATSAFGKSSR